MDISFIILTWNSENYIKKCVDSLIHSVGNRQLVYEIFIVDNGSTDRTPFIISEIEKLYHGKIKGIFLKNNTGTTYSRNLALRKAKGRHIAILDSDIEIAYGTIEKLMYVLDSDKRAGLVAPRIIYPDGRLQKSIDKFPSVFSKLIRFFFLRKIEALENSKVMDLNVKEVDYAISAMWIFKKELLDNVGLLDEKIFYAPEDVDYCLRIWKMGYKILYVPEVFIIHHAQEISRRFKINQALINHLKGLIYYFRKHRYFIVRPKVRESIYYD